jgi:hypothetical protein
MAAAVLLPGEGYQKIYKNTVSLLKRFYIIVPLFGQQKSSLVAAGWPSVSLLTAR